MVTITFLGAAGTVTGSKYLVQGEKTKILVDAGMFQGEHRWTDVNWEDPSWDVKGVQAVLLTHAHIDHVGILPRLGRFGLNCPVMMSAPTAALARLLLLDSARLHEEEAEYRGSRGYSRFDSPQPLYTTKEVEALLPKFRTIQFHQEIEIAPGVKATWRRMGHILGAASIELQIDGKRIVFSGDIGRYTVPILKDPEPVTQGDVLLIESTYGDTLHSAHDPEASLAAVINETAKRGGSIVIPSFAVGRTQSLLFYIRALKQAHKIPDLPVVVDSPMASDATKLYAAFPSDYDEESLGLLRDGVAPFQPARMAFTRTREESIKLNSIDEPMILIAASGMLTGGRILHHLRHRISDPRNSVLFVGHQPVGGKGDWIQKGNATVRLFGTDYPVRAQIATMSGLSAHADKDELLRWCKESNGAPGMTYVVHGEPESATAFASTLTSQLGWKTKVAEYQQTITV